MPLEDIERSEEFGNDVCYYATEREQGKFARFSYLDNKVGQSLVVTCQCLEITTFCKKTQQADFGEIHITYLPRERFVETKTLKLYCQAYRDKSMFQEEIVNQFLRDFVVDIKPQWVKVEGHFNVRGGVRQILKAEWKWGDVLISCDDATKREVYVNEEGVFWKEEWESRNLHQNRFKPPTRVTRRFKGEED